MNSETTVMCPDCGGDGVETCDNPDHGFIDTMNYIASRPYNDIGRLGCPVCGHDPNHKLHGSICPTCNGAGKISAIKAREVE